MIAKEKAENFRQKMEVSSFGAWQILQNRGYKRKWEDHKKMLGLNPVKSREIQKSEIEEIRSAAMSIHERVLRLQKNG